MAEERTLRLGIDPGPAERGARDFERAGNRVNRAADGMSGRMKVAAAAAAAFGGALALRETVQAIVRMAEVGAAAEETASKYRTVLGPAITETNTFLDEFATKAGLSERAAQDLVATTAAMAQGFGFTRSAAASLATDVTQLAGDLASFNNLPTEEVARSIQSAMAGERESLKRLGIVIMEADVQERALLNTRKASAVQLTQAEKALATYQLVAERAGVAMGDLDRTQDSLANQMKAATAAGVNLRDQVGGLVADALEASGAVGALTESLEGLSDWVDTHDDDIRTAFTGFLVGIGNAAPAGLKDIFLGWASNIQAAAVEAQGLAAEAQYLDGIEGSIAARKEQQAQAAREAAEAAAAAAKAQREALEAVQNTAAAAQLWADAVDLGVLSTVEELGDAQAALTESADEMRGILDDQAASLEMQVAAAEALLEIEEQRARLAGRSGITADVANFSGRTGAIPGGTGVGSGFAVRMPQITSAIADIITAGLQVAETNARNAADAEEELATQRQAETDAMLGVIGGATALVDGLFDLDNAALRSLRGIGNIVDGVQTLTNIPDEVDGLAKTATQIAGVMSVLGGVGSMLQGLFSDTQAAQIEAAREDFARSLDAFVDGLADATRWEKARNDVAKEARKVIAKFTKGLTQEQFPLDLFTTLFDDRQWDSVADITASLEKFADFFGDDILTVLDEYLEKIRAIEEERRKEAEALEGDIRVRMLVAQGRDAEAEALRLQIERQDEMARARELEDEALLGLLATLYEMEDAALAAAKAAEEEAEAKRNAATRASFAADVEARGLTLGGQDRDALAVTMQAQAAAELAAAQDMLEAGTISQELFDALAAVLAGELTKALADFDAQAAEAARTLKEAADAERFRAMMDTENLRVRLLVAQGMEDEAFALQQQLELMEAMEQGRDEEYLAMLRQLHQVDALNRARDAERQAIEDTSRAIDGMTRALNAPAGLPLALHRARTMGVGGGPAFSPNPIQGPAPVNVEQVNIYAQPGQDGRQLFREFMAEANRRGRAGDGFVLPEA